eukprot:Awhi_evm1s2845
MTNLAKCKDCGVLKIKHLLCIGCYKKVVEKTKEVRKEVTTRSNAVLEEVLSKRKQFIADSINSWDLITKSLEIDHTKEIKPKKIKRLEKGQMYHV